MLAELDKIFVFIAIVALPNLYFQAQYNVPLMLFCYAIWAPAYRSLIMYLLLFSWFVDGYRLFNDISHKDQNQYEKKQLVIVLMVCLFILKILCIILLMVFNIDCRNALNPSKMCDNFKETFFEQKKQQ